MSKPKLKKMDPNQSYLVTIVEKWMLISENVKNGGQMIRR